MAGPAPAAGATTGSTGSVIGAPAPVAGSPTPGTTSSTSGSKGCSTGGRVWGAPTPGAPIPPGRGASAMAPVLDRLGEVGADVLRVGDPSGLPLHTADVGEDLLPLLEILPLQQLAWRLALDRGEDPDRPRGLAKVTSTW